MVKDVSSREPFNKSVVYLNEEWEVKYWAGFLACSVTELKNAVRAVGQSAELVRRYLKTSH